MKRFFIFLFILLFASVVYAKNIDYLVKELSQCPSKVYGGGFLVKEVIHPKNDGVNPGFSTAYIVLKSHKKTEPHKLSNSNQVFFVIKGKAKIHIGNKVINAKPNMAIYINKNVWQWAENDTDNDFVFLCIVSPPWYKKEEVVKK